MIHDSSTRHVRRLVTVLAVSLLTVVPALAQAPNETSDSSGEATGSVTGVLPAEVLGRTRGPITSTTLEFPLGPQPNPDHRPFLLFVPEALRTVSDAPDSLRVVRAQYEGGPQPVFVGIVDYGAIPSNLRSQYLSATADGEAEKGIHSVEEHDLLLLRGNGSSDDVVLPHGVKVLAGGRYEVVVFEQPPEGVSSVAEFDALATEKIDEMVARAENCLSALDLAALVNRAGAEK